MLLLNLVQTNENTLHVMWDFSAQVFLVLMAEIVADWVKHAFITKFNGHDSGLYTRFTLVLVRSWNLVAVSIALFALSLCPWHRLRYWF